MATEFGQRRVKYEINVVLGGLRDRMPTQQFGFILPHPCGLLIRRDLPESEVGAIVGVAVRDMDTGYVWYDLPLAEMAGQAIAMSICFFKEALESLHVAVVDEKVDGSSWADWSEEKERARAEATGRWFADVGYPVGTYGWGTVYAYFDAKSGGGGGGIRFHPPIFGGLDGGENSSEFSLPATIVEELRRLRRSAGSS